MTPPRIAVVGSINLDIVASAERLPTAGETVTGATLSHHPGGKGANQALAACRLGASTRLFGRVGRDAAAEQALALLRRDGVDVSGVRIDDNAATGVALIAVAANGENQIVVAPGTNSLFGPSELQPIAADAIIAQLELPIATVEQLAQVASAFLCINLAPAQAVSAALLARADLLVVNDSEAAFYGSRLQQARGLVAVTHGARGATLWRGANKIASAVPPAVKVLDSTGAGDAFVAALTLALLEQQPHAQALRFACTAGALAATTAGAQPSLPTRAAVDANLRLHSEEPQL